MFLVVEDLSKRYDVSFGTVHTLEGVSFSVPAGSCVSLVGPSGCGKTTLLEIIAGVTPCTSGRVFLAGQEVTGPSRQVALAFQDYALFPWRTVAGNVHYPLEIRSVPKAVRRERVAHYLRLFDIWEFREAYPHQLSGGMKQRVALARSLVTQPDLLLLDEPFNALDNLTRRRACEAVFQILEELSATILFVTHDLDEAIRFSSRILVITGKPGNVSDVIHVAGTTDLLAVRVRLEEVIRAGD